MNEIILSICIPTYNRVDKLKKTLANLVLQVEKIAGEGIEIIVSNNASTDSTCDYLKTLDYPFVTVNNNETNLGYGGNVRWLINKSKGAYIQILSDDDEYDSDMIQSEYDFLAANTDIDYCFVPCKGNKLSTGNMPALSFFEQYKMGCALCGSNIIRKRCIDLDTVKSDIWLHCDLLFNMAPSYVHVFDSFIDLNMPGSDDKNYWHNKADTVIDYDTEMLKLINESRLSSEIKQILFLYYKQFLCLEIINWKRCVDYETEMNCIFADRLSCIEGFEREKKLFEIKGRSFKTYFILIQIKLFKLLKKLNRK